MNSFREEKANLLINKIKHFLISTIGRMEKDATSREFYYAFCMALRDELMVNWTSTIHTIQKKQAKQVYYISMEYLPGKFLMNNMCNLHANELIQLVLKKTNRNWIDLIKCDTDISLGNGGLGRLASCLLDSMATHHFPAWAYGLRYQYGIFEQEIWGGNQVERPDRWLRYQNPWEYRQDTHAQKVHFCGRPLPAINTHGDEVFLLEDFEEVRALPYDIPIVGYKKDTTYSVNTLRLWSTKESPRNFALQRYNAGQLDQAGENTSITDVLYPNDNHDVGKRIRLKQEFLLVSASLQDIIKNHIHVYGDISKLDEKVQIQINDTHPVLIIIELMRKLTKDFDFSWNNAFEMTKNCCNYTNHTILREALEEWNEQRLEYLLPRQYFIIQKLNQQMCNEIRKKYVGDEEKLRRMSFIEKGQIKMANLAIYCSKKINGVSSIHSQILEFFIFPDFYQMFPKKFLSITNGVSQRNWLLECNPLLSEFINKKIGDEWITNFEEIKNLKNFANNKDSQEEFLKIKNENKKNLLSYINQYNPIRDHKGQITDHFYTLDTEAIFDVQIKRIHEYKRQLLTALHAIMLYQELESLAETKRIKRMVIFGGKAAPGYQIAKDIICLIFCIAKKIKLNEQVKKKLSVVFMEDYNVSHAGLIIPATDLSEQISTAGMEASGTGNMKLTMNGALTIGTDDGANIEMKQAISKEWWPFTFGLSAEQVSQLKKENRNTAQEVYLENEKIKKAVDALKDGSFVTNDQEHQSLSQLYRYLMDGPYNDPYFVLKDLWNYYETQKKVEELYQKPNLWAETALNNIAGMGQFSSDYVVKEYAKEIWDIHPCPISKEIEEKTKEEFAMDSLFQKN